MEKMCFFEPFLNQNALFFDRFFKNVEAKTEVNRQRSRVVEFASRKMHPPDSAFSPRFFDGPREQFSAPSAVSKRRHEAKIFKFDGAFFAEKKLDEADGNVVFEKTPNFVLRVFDQRAQLVVRHQNSIDPLKVAARRKVQKTIKFERRRGDSASREALGQPRFFGF